MGTYAFKGSKFLKEYPIPYYSGIWILYIMMLVIKN